jgi:hypothetical protein
MRPDPIPGVPAWCRLVCGRPAGVVADEVRQERNEH